MLLFVREFKADARFGGAGAYTYLGTVNYVKHEGSRPMNITWRLDRPIPAKFLKKTNKLVVGFQSNAHRVLRNVSRLHFCRHLRTW